MIKSKTPGFVLTLSPITKGRDVAVMRKRFEAGKRRYNAFSRDCSDTVIEKIKKINVGDV
jgi:hypothetical protein